MNNLAIIIELDYKGYYGRYAYTQDEWDDICRDLVPAPTTVGDSCTLRPLVHLWYKLVEIGGKEWTNFFTDMSYQLPDSDIANGNFAYIDFDECLSLKDTILATIANP